MRKQTGGVLVVGLVHAVMALWGQGVSAQEYPVKPVRFVVPYGSGGQPDVTTRVMTKKLAELLGQAIVVDNRPGGAGIPAADHVAKSPPDGYTVLLGDPGPLAINPALYPKLPYDPVKDFAPITVAASTPLFFVVNASLPVKSIRELIDYVKANPGLNYGSIGNGSVHHLGLELFQMLAGVKMTHIPYKGVAQAVPAAVTGDVALVVSAYTTIKPHLDSGKLRAIAAMNIRSAVLPDVPLISEAGLPEFEMKVRSGYLAPAGTPRRIIDRLNTTIRASLASPEVTQTLAAVSINTHGSTPEEYAEAIRQEVQLFARLIKASGVKID
jgi:tripartite-type tricarboxylate transporter receptor subunit TctC